MSGAPTIGVVLIELDKTAEIAEIQQAVSRAKVFGHMNILTFKISDDSLRPILSEMRKASR